MTLGLESYGSDDDSDVVSEPTLNAIPTTTTPAQKPPPSSLSSSKKSTFSLPPPSNVTATKPTKRPKKIAVELPKILTKDDDDDDGKKPAKKPRLSNAGKGAGSSSLLSMLPAPKEKNPTPATFQRVLGGGGRPAFVFDNNGPSAPVENVEGDDVDEFKSSQPLFMPTSVSRGKANISVEESIPRARVPASTAAVDFFSIGESSSSKPTLPDTLKRPQAAALSSAPKIDEFTPPEPTPQDPYPGYYLLPSGKYAAYDPEYYQLFYKRWQADYDKYVRDLEKGKIKGFEELDEEQAIGVNAMEEMEKARVSIQELEQRKALTKGQDEQKAPKMNIQGAGLGGRAKSRHQLATLLTEAYQNREALEEQIAQGRRNRKEAGNKYGF